MITRHDAAHRAYQITEYQADDPENGWELDVFSHGWLVCRNGRDQTEFCIVIERDTGLVRYFLGIAPQRISADYETVRQAGYPDYLWAEPGHEDYPHCP